MSKWYSVISNIKLDSDKIIAGKVKCKENKFNIICPSCGNADEEIHFLYE